MNYICRGYDKTDSEEPSDGVSLYLHFRAGNLPAQTIKWLKACYLQGSGRVDNTSRITAIGSEAHSAVSTAPMFGVRELREMMDRR